jgi:p-aminobenzoyl-glutamate transporter AbgT
MTQIGEVERSDKPWWSRIHRVWWVVAIVAVLVMIGIAVFEKVIEPAPMSYSAFLDQLDAGNVASVTFQGTAID